MIDFFKKPFMMLLIAVNYKTIYSGNLRSLLEYGKIRTRKNPHLDTFHTVFENPCETQNFGR